MEPIGGIMNMCESCPNTGTHAFCNLGQESQAFLESNTVSMEYPRGTVIFREGDVSTAVFVLCSGKVKISATSKEGRTMILRISDAGDVLGLSSAFTDSDY